MQKIRSQIMLEADNFLYVSEFCAMYRMKNHSQGINAIIKAFMRQKDMIRKLKEDYETTQQDLNVGDQQ